MNFNTVLKKRASIRKFSDKKPSYDKIISAIEAANLAPAPGNLSSLKFIIIENQESIDKITQACQQPFVGTAKVLVAVCSDSKNIKTMFPKRADKYTKQHAGAAIENFLLKITEMGLASTWIAAFSEETIKNTLKIPEDIDVQAILPIAYKHKTDKTKQKPKQNLDTITYFENWKKKHRQPTQKVGMH